MIHQQVRVFGQAATGLARNPLGIIALFIVLVYGFACLVTVLSGSFSERERIILVYFLVLFPVIVLGVFGWLVSGHSGKLFAPSDFKNEDNYVKMQLSAVASLAIAASKKDIPFSRKEVEGIVDIVHSSAPSEDLGEDTWRNHVLWVDDRQENNVFERQAFEAYGIRFTLVESTSEALSKLKIQRFAAVISDMGRREGPREGYKLLDELRSNGNKIPLFFYASSRAPEHIQETLNHGGQGCTNDAQELFQMVTRAVISTRR
ncbi:CheY-like chemotaxis protein [Chelatococcus caeni]|uniref:CheY-like chemotaxis protein n=1 Tax=Chelatococcus caeni TaxID=1348468 RepID=A0A840BXT1_9HYPH|nr:response regulator [Chelatococcus caeni]MBB4017790.1 CheY-like chemotaxis protein [Chelatococcus caeni]